VYNLVLQQTKGYTNGHQGNTEKNDIMGQFLHVFSLNELVDISKIYAKELSRIRGISPANLNTFSNANRTRNPSVMEKFFWMMYDHFKSQDETFIKAKHKGKLSRFKLRAYNCFKTL
jgi:hypothetical protein